MALVKRNTGFNNTLHPVSRQTIRREWNSRVCWGVFATMRLLGWRVNLQGGNRFWHRRIQVPNWTLGKTKTKTNKSDEWRGSHKIQNTCFYSAVWYTLRSLFAFIICLNMTEGSGIIGQNISLCLKERSQQNKWMRKKERRKTTTLGLLGVKLTSCNSSTAGWCRRTEWWRCLRRRWPASCQEVQSRLMCGEKQTNQTNKQGSTL